MIEQSSLKNGLLIVIEGIDGSGKSSVIQKLGETFFQGEHPVITRQPGGSSFAEKLRGSCLNEDISPRTQTLFFLSLLNDGFEKEIVPNIKDKRLVISDRGYGSTLAYQGFPHGQHWLIQDILDQSVTPVSADLTIYLSIPLDKAIERESGQGRSVDRYASSERIVKEKIKESYDRMYLTTHPETDHFKMTKGRDNKFKEAVSKTTKSIAVVDATQSLEDVVRDCKAAINNLIKNENASI